jgi:hypothetical protein
MLRRTSWAIPWFSSLGNEFNDDMGAGAGFALNVFLREGDNVYRTYFTTATGVERLGSSWAFLDLTGRRPGNTHRKAGHRPHRTNGGAYMTSTKGQPEAMDLTSTHKNRKPRHDHDNEPTLGREELAPWGVWGLGPPA